MTKMFNLFGEGWGVYECSCCGATANKGEDPNRDWILRFVGYEGVSGLPPRQLFMVCPKCYYTALDINWESAEMVRGQITGTWYLTADMIERTAA